MTKTTTTRPAPGRGSARHTTARRPSSTTATAVSRARAARRQLGSRQERFAHLKQMHD